MKKNLAWIGVPAAAIVIAASVFLMNRPAPSPDAGALAPAPRIDAGLAALDAPAPLPAMPTMPPELAEAGPFRRRTETKGDMTSSYLRGGDLGYVDVDAIVNRNDPSSIAALLQAHGEASGASESLEIEITSTSVGRITTKARFDQIIDGRRIEYGAGSVNFDTATGAVNSIMATLFAPDPGLAGSIAIGREEAVALARAAVERAVIEREPVSILTSGGPGRAPRLLPGERLTIIENDPQELRYALDPETNKTRAEWPVRIEADVGPGLLWELLVDASTGEIVGIEDRIDYYASDACSDITFRPCYGANMRKMSDKCSDSGPLYPTDYTQPDAKAAIDAANSMLNDIK